jgi:uncharacterized protein YaiI (UPF0178 family)
MTVFKGKIVTTPSILTEISNLADKLADPDREKCFLIFSQFVSTLNEIYIESKEITKNEKFVKFGITDCGILSTVKDKYLVLTDDFKLANYLQSVNIDVINFNHLRF